jgi:hypothetical protein
MPGEPRGDPTDFCINPSRRWNERNTPTTTDNTNAPRINSVFCICLVARKRIAGGERICPAMNNLTLAELKQLARDHEPRIKMYYVLPKARLLELLTMETLPEEMVIAKTPLYKLRNEARRQGHVNVWKMKRADVLTLLYPRPQEHDHNQEETDKHNHPEAGESEDVGVEV